MCVCVCVCVCVSLVLADDDGLDNVSVDDGVPATEDHDARHRRLPPPSDSQGDASSTRRRSEELLPEGLTLGKQTTPRVRRPFSPVSTVITESRQSPRQWLSALRSRRRRERGRSARQGGAVRAHRMAGRMRTSRRVACGVWRVAARDSLGVGAAPPSGKKLHSRRRARAAQGGSGSDSDSGSSSGSEDSTAVNLGQVEMVLSMMPRGDSVVLSAFEDAVNVVPPLHEVRIRSIRAIVRACLLTRLPCVRGVVPPDIQPVLATRRGLGSPRGRGRGCLHGGGEDGHKLFGAARYGASPGRA